MAAVLAAMLAVGAPTAGSAPVTLSGTVESGGTGLAGYAVTVYRTVPDAAPEVLGATTTDGAGAFGLDVDVTADGEHVVYALARSAGTTPVADEVTMAAVLGPDPAPTVTINPRTTVATAYAMAQFLDGGAIRGPVPGVPNGAAMSRNVADPVTGAIGDVLDAPPNGDETTARRTFNSMANVVAACVASDTACQDLFAAATPTGGAAPTDSLQALRDVVRDPSHAPDAVFAVSTSGPRPYAPNRDTAPAAWTLALRFDGGPDIPSADRMNGPGNFAMDHEGTMWAVNNYTYAEPGTKACASDLMLRFAPDGSYVPGSPYRGGGLSGAGYGIIRDRYGVMWASNFGFAAAECSSQPPHDTMSRVAADGTILSPPEGDLPVGIDWPQGMAFNDAGDLWVANCAGDSVTVIPDGDISRSKVLTDLGVVKPFDVAFGSDGNAYVTGTKSNNLAVVQPDGTPVPGSPFSGYNRPMGIVASSTGELWIANSGLIDLPCPVKDEVPVPPPSLGYIDPATGETTTFHGGGLLIPWGISVDGHDNVWVANFGGLRLSGFCGRDDSPHCPPGSNKGDPLSPDVTGYDFDGLRRSTATATDSAGNVWVTNNWKEDPAEINPGGYQVVVFLGLAGPVTPPPAPEPRPTTTTTTSTTVPATSAAAPVVVRPAFTG